MEFLETGFSECSEISEIVVFRTFQNLRKNDVKLELWKSRKTLSDSKTDSKVWNAGPYFLLWTLSLLKSTPVSKTRSILANSISIIFSLARNGTFRITWLLLQIIFYISTKTKQGESRKQFIKKFYFLSSSN